MDLNQTGFSHSSASNKNKITSSTSNKYNYASDDSVKNTFNPSSEGKQREFHLSEVKQGQLIKGEIVDHRYQEVSIRVENSQQVLTARLHGVNSLSIGEEAVFVVTEAHPDRLVLQYIPKESKPLLDSTAEKALIAAGLSKTEQNIAIVLELLNQRMSVDKQTLQQLIRLSHSHKEITPQALVLMHKLNIPITKENISQYEAYQTRTHQLSEAFHELLPNITSLLNTQNGKSELSAQIHGDLLHLLQSDIAVEDTPLASELPAADYLNKDELLQVEYYIRQKSEDRHSAFTHINEDPNLPKLQNGTISLQELMQSLIGIKNQATEPFLDAGYQLFDRISDLIFRNQQSRGEVGVIFNKSELVQLSDILQPLELPDQLKDQIKAGTATLPELITLLGQKLPHVGGDILPSLLSSPVYHKLLEEGLRHRWFLTPDRLEKADHIRNYYETLQTDIDKLKEMVKNHPELEDAAKITSQGDKLQDNVNFMKSLQELFSYVQLPLQGKEKNAHGDLYVFSRKRGKQMVGEAFTVLLHLTMPSLGDADIHITLKERNIKATFYLESALSRTIMKENLPLLEKALEKKGYQLNASIEETYERLDFTQDILKHNQPHSQLDRYTFDIRT
ncbi:MAG: hypothetical protein K0S47_1169 [Herbinix sp.]|jgi:hypothetical protein|nr:hypothetical protein [Herbinix sp.]